MVTEEVINTFPQVADWWVLLTKPGKFLKSEEGIVYFTYS